MEAVSYSRFPAAVTSERRRERRAALVVLDGQAQIAVVVKGSGVRVVETFEVAELAQAGRRVTLTDTDGIEWVVERGDGCSCASPLRSWYNTALGSPRRSGT